MSYSRSHKTFPETNSTFNQNPQNYPPIRDPRIRKLRDENLPPKQKDYYSNRSPSKIDQYNGHYDDYKRTSHERNRSRIRSEDKMTKKSIFVPTEHVKLIVGPNDNILKFLKDNGILMKFTPSRNSGKKTKSTNIEIEGESYKLKNIERNFLDIVKNEMFIKRKKETPLKIHIPSKSQHYRQIHSMRNSANSANWEMNGQIGQNYHQHDYPPQNYHNRKFVSDYPLQTAQNIEMSYGREIQDGDRLIIEEGHRSREIDREFEPDGQLRGNQRRFSRFPIDRAAEYSAEHSASHSASHSSRFPIESHPEKLTKIGLNDAEQVEKEKSVLPVVIKIKSEGNFKVLSKLVKESGIKSPNSKDLPAVCFESPPDEFFSQSLLKLNSDETRKLRRLLKKAPMDHPLKELLIELVSIKLPVSSSKLEVSDKRQPIDSHHKSSESYERQYNQNFSERDSREQQKMAQSVKRTREIPQANPNYNYAPNGGIKRFAPAPRPMQHGANFGFSRSGMRPDIYNESVHMQGFPVDQRMMMGNMNIRGPPMQFFPQNRRPQMIHNPQMAYNFHPRPENYPQNPGDSINFAQNRPDKRPIFHHNSAHYLQNTLNANILSETNREAKQPNRKTVAQNDVNERIKNENNDKNLNQNNDNNFNNNNKIDKNFIKLNEKQNNLNKSQNNENSQNNKNTSNDQEKKSDKADSLQDVSPSLLSDLDKISSFLDSFGKMSSNFGSDESSIPGLNIDQSKNSQNTKNTKNTTNSTKNNQNISSTAENSLQNTQNSIENTKNTQNSIEKSSKLNEKDQNKASNTPLESQLLPNGKSKINNNNSFQHLNSEYNKNIKSAEFSQKNNAKAKMNGGHFSQFGSDENSALFSTYSTEAESKLAEQPLVQRLGVLKGWLLQSGTFTSIVLKRMAAFVAKILEEISAEFLKSDNLAIKAMELLLEQIYESISNFDENDKIMLLNKIKKCPEPLLENVVKKDNKQNQIKPFIKPTVAVFSSGRQGKCILCKINQKVFECNWCRFVYCRSCVGNLLKAPCKECQKNLTDIEKIILYQSISFDEGKKRIINSFNSSGEFQETSCVLPLYDPYTFKRIKIPCRGKSCKHRNIFDLDTFLKIKTKNGKQRFCPICKAQIVEGEIEVDKYVERIIVTEPEDVREVVVRSDGSWSQKENSNSDAERNFLTVNSDFNGVINLS